MRANARILPMPDPSDRSHGKTHIVWCLVTSLIVAATTYLVGWYGYRNWIFSMDPSAHTWRDLLLLRDKIEKYRQANGKLPKSLNDLDIVKNPCDSWGKPLVYRVEGDRFVLMSYGRDEQPGGSGSDADIFADPDAGPPKMSFWEFTEDSTPQANGVKLCALVAGLLTLPLCLLPSPRRTPGGIVKKLAVHAVTGVFAIIAAMFMSMFHLNGH